MVDRDAVPGHRLLDIAEADAQGRVAGRKSYLGKSENMPVARRMALRAATRKLSPAWAGACEGMAQSISRSDRSDLNEKELLKRLKLGPFLVDQVIPPDRKRRRGRGPERRPPARRRGADGAGCGMAERPDHGPCRGRIRVAAVMSQMRVGAPASRRPYRRAVRRHPQGDNSEEGRRRWKRLLSASPASCAWRGCAPAV
jgi:hypothetical protein